MDGNITTIVLNLIFTWLATTFVYWLINYLRDIRTYWRVKGLPMLPIIGNLHQIDNNGVDFLKLLSSLARKYHDEPLFRIYRGWLPVIIFHKADHVGVLFSSSKHTEKSFDYEFLKPWLKTGLLISHGDKWSIRRKLITPTFHFDVLTNFLLTMNENVDTFILNLTEYAKNGKEVDMFKKIGLCALDIICETAMGTNIEAQNKPDSDYIRAVFDITTIIRARGIYPPHWIDSLFELTSEGHKHKKNLETLLGFTRNIILKRDEDFNETDFGTQKRIAFLDMLLKVKNTDNSLTFDDIQEEVDTFMFEGHDTTSCSLAWASHLIGSHPEVQKKIQDELDDIFGDSDRHVTNEDLGKMKYLEMVIKETMRLFPAVPFHGRIISEDIEVGKLNPTVDNNKTNGTFILFIFKGGFRLRKGLSIVIFSYMIHRDEKYWPNPEKFDPERFLPENSRDRHPFAYIPFSAGKRNCIGQRFAMMEMKVLLANIFRKFDIMCLKSTEELKPCGDIILKPSNGIPVNISLRKKSL